MVGAGDGKQIRCANYGIHHSFGNGKVNFPASLTRSNTRTPTGFRLPIHHKTKTRPSGPAFHFGAGDGNRTHVTSLEGWGSTIELHPPKDRSLCDIKTLCNTVGSGGEKRIRTSEGGANGFTIHPCWPLRYLPVKPKASSPGLILKERALRRA